MIAARLEPPAGPELLRAMAIEHDELATATADAAQALHRWAGGTGDGRAALAAVRVQLDDLVVHQAHEAAAVERALAAARRTFEPGRDPGGPTDAGPDERALASDDAVLDALHAALADAPLTEPPFLGPLTLAEASSAERRALLEHLPHRLLVRWTGAEAAHAEATRRAMGA